MHLVGRLSGECGRARTRTSEELPNLVTDLDGLERLHYLKSLDEALDRRQGTRLDDQVGEELVQRGGVELAATNLGENTVQLLPLLIFTSPLVGALAQAVSYAGGWWATVRAAQSRSTFVRTADPRATLIRAADARATLIRAGWSRATLVGVPEPRTDRRTRAGLRPIAERRPVAEAWAFFLAGSRGRHRPIDRGRTFE